MSADQLNASEVPRVSHDVTSRGMCSTVILLRSGQVQVQRLAPGYNQPLCHFTRARRNT